MSNIDVANMSDDEFEQLDTSNIELPQNIDNNNEQDESENIEGNTTDSTGSDEVQEDVNSANNSDELTNNNNSTNIQENDSETPQENTEEVNYEEFYKQVMAPFKGNNKTITLKSADEAIHLMQAGVNYTQKMQQIGPYRKALLMLEKNGLLDENQLSFLIDVKNKNPEAIKKFLKDNNIDPLDIDTAQEPKYTAGSNIISDDEVNFVEAIKEVKSFEGGEDTLKLIQNTWDDGSINMLVKDPTGLREIHNQIKSGVYNQIKAEMDRRSMVGTLDNTKPFLQNYIDVAYSMMQGGNQNQSQQNYQNNSNVVTRPASSAKYYSLSNNNKVRQAGISSKSSIKKGPNVGPNPLLLSDEEFEKQFGGNMY